MNTVGCTTGWVNYANEPSQAALERSSQDAYDAIRLTRSKAAVWTYFSDTYLVCNLFRSCYNKCIKRLIDLVGFGSIGL